MSPRVLSKPIKNLVLVVRSGHPQVEQISADLVHFLKRDQRVHLALCTTTEDAASWPDNIDLVIVLGGDGTILRTCRHMGRQQLPMLGLNLGRLGFLADLSPPELYEQFDSLLKGDYVIERQLMFECRLSRNGHVIEDSLGLNEVAIHAGGALRLLHVELSINDEHVATYGCDGLIVSTPIGSTAHNLAAGGPILRQGIEAFCITPICPHTLTNRPLVDRADGVYKLGVPHAPHGTTLVIDGQIKRPLEPGDEITVTGANVSCLLTRMPSHSYYRTLHQKLGWALLPYAPGSPGKNFDITADDDNK
jgi:NAD+ kinase